MASPFLGVRDYCEQESLCAGAKGVATHTSSDHTCRRINAKTEQFEAQLHAAYARDCGAQKVHKLCEFINPQRFRFFLDVCAVAELEDDDIMQLTKITSATLSRFVHNDILRAAVLVAPGTRASTRARLVYYDIVVNRERALSMHALVKCALFRESTGRLRVVLSGVQLNARETVMCPQWDESLPNQLYLSALDQGVPMVGSTTFIRCSEEGQARNHDGCAVCKGTKFVASGTPLLFHTLVNSGGTCEQAEKDESTRLRHTVEMAVTDGSSWHPDIIHRTALRTSKPVTEPWNEPIGCPRVPFTISDRGAKVTTLFSSERASTIAGTRKRETDSRITSCILEAVRGHHTKYASINLRGVWSKVVSRSTEYDVYVAGEGETYCQNNRDFHAEPEPLGGRVSFKITRTGISQRCFCRVTPASGIPCTQFRQEEQPLSDKCRRILGFNGDSFAGEGDFFHRLTRKYLPELHQLTTALGPNGKREQSTRADEFAYAVQRTRPPRGRGWPVHDFLPPT